MILDTQHNNESLGPEGATHVGYPTLCGRFFVEDTHMRGKAIRKWQWRWAAGFNWCTSCKTLKPHSRFSKDCSRTSGLSTKCKPCSAARSRRGHLDRKDVFHSRGRWFVATRPGDKIQARQRVVHAVKMGLLPKADSLPCTDCGHTGTDRRHEYHHHNGYDESYHLDVIPLCSVCHHHRDKPLKTHCYRGHEFTPKNTIVKSNGTRGCKECRKLHDRKRGRDAAYWREYRRKRKEGSVSGK